MGAMRGCHWARKVIATKRYHLSVNCAFLDQSIGNGDVAVRTPHEPTAPGREDER